MVDSTYMTAPGATNEDLAIRRKLAMALMQQGMDTSPVQHWTQGAARALQGALGGYELYQAGQEANAADAKKAEFYRGFLDQGQAAPQAAPQASPAPMVDSSQPRGLRNNNPLNIEAGGFTQGQPGFAGTDGRFAKFASLADGTNAADKLLQVYAGKHKLDTPAGIVGRWAPAADGNPVDSYAASVAKAMGVDPNARLDMSSPDTRQKLIAAMAQFENGRPLPQATAPAVSAGNPAQARLVEALRSPDPNIRRAAMGMAESAVQQQMRPQDYDIHHTPDGRIIATNKKNPADMRVISRPGDDKTAIDFNAQKAAAEKKAVMEAERAVVKPERDKQKATAANIVVDDIDRSLALIEKNPRLTTGPIGALTSVMPGSPAHNVAKLIDTIESNAGFDRLQAMREASPTGGALGAVAVPELLMLQSAIGSLKQSQDADQLKYNLRRVKNIYQDIIHGPGNGPRESLGKTPDGIADVKAVAVRVSTPDEARKLPKGTKIILPDGSEGIVP